ncbi:hypothetical protein CBS101457_005968 [Exobasidium rhododendri]|nr:hypothetical protein CBS101457_005968 [Exobasidium rhododendri]
MMSAPAPYPTVQLSAPTPDDHQITSRTPSICVDYLSHNWTDEDVWSSWKAMTKRKNEIANGVRLENASWRTWAKQRGKLKTISPETLNWLKDSDVTWLYGPLHEHAEPVPPPKVASAQDRLDLDDSVRTKSILKHRTISEMLTTPGRSASPVVEYLNSSAETSREGSVTDGDHLKGNRPAIFAVKSDSNLAARKRKAGGSPQASERLFQNLVAGVKEDGLTHQVGEERKHISFNQRVEQCISVDVEEEEEEEEEEDDNYSDGLYDGSKRDREEEDDDTPSSDEEVLTMRSSPRTSPAWPLTSNASSQGSSPSLEHQTIAKLAPTMLKTTDVFPAPSPQVVDPTGFTGMYNTAPSGVETSLHSNSQSTVSCQPQAYQYGGGSEDEEGHSQTRYSQWDADDDFNGDFDYFNGPDMSDNYEQTHPIDVSNVPKDEVASKLGSHPPSPNPSSNQENGSEGQSSVEATSAPRSILKKRSAPVVSNEEANAEGSSPVKISTDSVTAATSASPTSPSVGGERGRSSQRLGSASYERVQDAANRGSYSAGAGMAGASPSPSAGLGGSSSRTRSNSNVSSGSNSSLEGTNTSAHIVNAPTASSSSSGQYSNTYGHKPSERRDSFRGKAGDGSKAMEGQSGSYAAAAAAVSPPTAAAQQGRRDQDSSSSSAAVDSDLDAAAFPSLGDDDAEGGDAKADDRGDDAMHWADAARGKSTSGKRQTSSSLKKQSGDVGEPARLSVDLDNLPSNNAGQVGPTPLNTPTFALARSRASKQAKSASSSKPNTDGTAGPSPEKGQDSPILPKRSSATGALVAPSDADKDAGVRVPLAHDYVEEDEGGIVGRAVEIVNTARDLIGALLGTGGDRGRSWRESY